MYLKDFDNVVNIFIHGDFEFRRQRAIHEHGIKEEISTSIVKKIDKERASYLNTIRTSLGEIQSIIIFA